MVATGQATSIAHAAVALRQNDPTRSLDKYRRISRIADLTEVADGDEAFLRLLLFENNLLDEVPVLAGSILADILVE